MGESIVDEKNENNEGGAWKGRAKNLALRLLFGLAFHIMTFRPEGEWGHQVAKTNANASPELPQM